MSAGLTDSLAYAVKTIAGVTVQGLKLDKTIVGTIRGPVRSGVYEVIYEGGSIKCYANNGATYMPNSSVYILVPEGNMNNKKTIIGLTSSTKEAYNLSTVSSILDGYSVISNNLLTPVEKNWENKTSLGVSSLEPFREGEQYQDLEILYQKGKSSTNYYFIDDIGVGIYAKEASGLMLSAKFHTNFPASQVYSKTNNVKQGDYGLILSLRFKNDVAVYSTMQEKWEDLIDKTEVLLWNSEERQYDSYSLQSYRDEIENLLKQNNIEIETVKNKIRSQKADVGNFLISTKDLLDDSAKELCQNYFDWLTQLNEYDITEISQFKTIYEEWFTNSLTTEGKDISKIFNYPLGVDNMIGDPYRFNNGWTYQFMIYGIDMTNFAGIEGLYLYCKNFDIPSGEKTRDTIKVKEISLYFVAEASDQSGDYSLELDCPKGRIFKTYSSGETLSIQGRMWYQKENDFTSKTSIMWFKENPTIQSTSDERYDYWGGLGWERLSDFQDGVPNSARIFYANENQNYENNYLCVATYNLEVFLKKQFTLYNYAAKRDIEIISDSGFSYGGGGSAKTLTCMVNGRESLFEDNDEITDDHYRFIWQQTLKNSTTFFVDSYEELQKNISTETDIAKREQLKIQANTIKNISWYGNKLIYPDELSLGESVNIKCTVEFTESLVEGSQEWRSVGSAEVTLTKNGGAALRGYTINIVNGSQVFQYNEAGASPCGDTYPQPYQPKTLECIFYDPSGSVVDPSKYNVKWQWPVESTMLVMDSAIAAEDPNGIKNLYIQDTCPIGIADVYNFNATNNQITCIVEYDGATYYRETTFFFGKMGENFTNATQVVAKISPALNMTTEMQDRTLLSLHVLPNGVDEETNEPIYEYVWSNGQLNIDPALKIELYRNNELINPSEFQNVKWSIAGNNNLLKNRMRVEPTILEEDNSQACYIKYDENPEDINSASYCRNHVIRGEVSLSVEDVAGKTNWQKYYGFYPMPIIVHKKSNIGYSIGLDKNKTLRQIMYNNEGASPQYNHNQGLNLILSDLPDNNPRYFHWTTSGGITYSEVERVSSVNPSEAGWWEEAPDGTYRRTNDIKIKPNKKYYTVTEDREIIVGENKNPVEENWFEWTGEEYSITQDTIINSSKIYYSPDITQKAIEISGLTSYVWKAVEGKNSPFLDLVDPLTNEVSENDYLVTQYVSDAQVKANTKKLQDEKQKIIDEWAEESYKLYSEYKENPNKEDSEGKTPGEKYLEALNEHIRILGEKEEEINNVLKQSNGSVGIKPKDFYDGETVNNHVKVIISKSKDLEYEPTKDEDFDKTKIYWKKQNNKFYKVGTWTSYVKPRDFRFYEFIKDEFFEMIYPEDYISLTNLNWYVSDNSEYILANDFIFDSNEDYFNKRYFEITDFSDENPKESGWYEINDNSEYILTEDEEINSEKVYYEIKYEIIEFYNGLNPKELNWYEINDIEEYILTEDEEFSLGKNYYQLINNSSYARTNDIYFNPEKIYYLKNEEFFNITYFSDFINPKELKWYEENNEGYILTQDEIYFSDKEYYSTIDDSYEKIENYYIYINPNELGWYIKNGENYILTDDLSLDETQIYYEKKDTYNPVEPFDYLNPKNLEWYEINEDNVEYEVYIPIHLYLNTYGLTNLNSWDGNSIEINEGEKYVLAPQIGAGKKNNEDNTFTGLLMGIEKTYNQDNETRERIGLLGYNHGKQSIWMDAETGKTVLGLPEDDAVDAGNPLTEGRIELVPGGTSRISRWRFDSRSLYRVISKNQINYLESGLSEQRLYTKPNYGNNNDFEELSAPYKSAPKRKAWSGIEDGNGIEGAGTDALGKWRYENGEGDLIPAGPLHEEIATSKAKAPKNAHGSIPHDQAGMLLSAAPTYLSIKGKPFGPPNANGISPEGIDYKDANTLIRPGDSLEVQIDPNDPSVFTIYAHYNPESHYVTNDEGKYVGEDGKVLNDQEEVSSRILETNEWYRIPRVGIDQQGRFYTNAVKDKSVSMSVGDRAGFGSPATAGNYTGAQFEIGEGESSWPLIKFITGKRSKNLATSPVFISSDMSAENEGTRPMGLYSTNWMGLYVGNNKLKVNPRIQASVFNLNYSKDEHNIVLGVTTKNKINEGDIDILNGSMVQPKLKGEQWYNTLIDDELIPTKTEIFLNHDGLGHFYHPQSFQQYIGQNYESYHKGEKLEVVLGKNTQNLDGGYSQHVGETVTKDWDKGFYFRSSNQPIKLNPNNTFFDNWERDRLRIRYQYDNSDGFDLAYYKQGGVKDETDESVRILEKYGEIGLHKESKLMNLTYYGDDIGKIQILHKKNGESGDGNVIINGMSSDGAITGANLLLGSYYGTGGVTLYAQHVNGTKGTTYAKGSFTPSTQDNSGSNIIFTASNQINYGGDPQAQMAKPQGSIAAIFRTAYNSAEGYSSAYFAPLQGPSDHGSGFNWFISPGLHIGYGGLYVSGRLTSTMVHSTGSDNAIKMGAAILHGLKVGQGVEAGNNIHSDKNIQAKLDVFAGDTTGENEAWNEGFYTQHFYGNGKNISRTCDNAVTDSNGKAIGSTTYNGSTSGKTMERGSTVTITFPKIVVSKAGRPIFSKSSDTIVAPSDYYKKGETYKKEEVDEKLAALKKELQDKFVPTATYNAHYHNIQNKATTNTTVATGITGNPKDGYTATTTKIDYVSDFDVSTGGPRTRD